MSALPSSADGDKDRASDRDFLTTLRDRKKDAVNVNWDEVHTEWLRDLDDLFARLQSWLAAAVRERLIAVSLGKIAIEEEKLTQYKAPSLAIALSSGEEVRVEPVARVVLGYLGRVDLIRMARRTSLLKKADGWIILRGKSPLDEEELTETSFQQALLELLPELE